MCRSPSQSFIRRPVTTSTRQASEKGGQHNGRVGQESLGKGLRRIDAKDRANRKHKPAEGENIGYKLSALCRRASSSR
jgi:hypothetical protein